MRESVSRGNRGTPDRSGHLRARAHGGVIGICASTGGPGALADVLGRLPADFAIPILVVQHMTPGFLGQMVAWLDKNLALPVGLADDGQQLAPGVWFAPDGTHLKLEATRRLRLDADAMPGKHRPSGDVLLASLARVARLLQEACGIELGSSQLPSLQAAIGRSIAS